MVINKLQTSTLITALATAAVAAAHEPATLDELLAGWGTNLADVEVRTETLVPGLHVLSGAGGNVVVSIGEQGVLMVDSQFPEMVPKLRKAIDVLGGGNIDFAVNTHWHFDHADGNPLLGREGTWLIAQENSRRMMLGSNVMTYTTQVYVQPPYPAEGLPVVAFDDAVQLYFNGQRIDIRPHGPAHTTGDAVVMFRRDNVVHMGDVLNTGFPFIDAENGGSLDGMIEFCRVVLAETDEDTVFVPGHGPVTDRAALQDFVTMLTASRQRIAELIDAGKALPEVIEADPTAEFNEQYGDPRLFIAKSYQSLIR